MPDSCDIAVIGGGPAGLMAAEVARAGGRSVTLFDALPSVGRKILIAGKGGLNLTHSEPKPQFVARYRERATEVGRWLDQFDADALRDWVHGFGIETIVGSSGRVFPADLRAAPLVRGWVRRLHTQGVRFRMQHRWLGFADDGGLRFATPDGERCVHAGATVLALGGGSWPRLGADGRWLPVMRAAGVEVADLVPANCGFARRWSDVFAARHAGAPVKPVAAAVGDAAPVQGEFVVTAHGIEGSLVYAWSAELRAALLRDGQATLTLDLLPGRSADDIAAALARVDPRRSLSERCKRALGLDGVRLGLLYECAPREQLGDPARLAAWAKALPVQVSDTRPLAEAISSAGGVRLEALDEQLMLRARPGVFGAGEMLDWEAPTGGYLLTACFASGVVAGRGALAWLARREAA